MRNTVLRKQYSVNIPFAYYGIVLLLFLWPQVGKANQGENRANKESPSAQTRVSPPGTPNGSPVNNANVEQPKPAVQAPEGHNEQAEATDKPVTRAEKIQIGISALMFIVVLGQTLIYLQQRRIMQTQVDHARIAERAYLGIDTIGLFPLVIGEYPTIRGFIQNGGRTPAFNVRAPGRIDFLVAGERPELEVIKSDFIADNNSVLAAGAKRMVAYEFTSVCDAAMKHQIEKGITTVFIQGAIWYEDAWGNEHHRYFFFEWSPTENAFMDRRERIHGEANQQNPDVAA